MEKGRIFMKNTLNFTVCELNRQKNEKMSEKSVTIIFLCFKKKTTWNFFFRKYRLMESNNLGSKGSAKFECLSCNYFTCRKSQFNRHILTDKHLLLINPNKKEPEDKLRCKCGKIYKHQSTLCAHKKKCEFKEEKIDPVATNTEFKMLTELFKLQMNENNDLKELMKEQSKQIYEQHKENQKLQQQLIEIAKEVKTTTNTNCNNNTNNFNLQFFLNEQCKDALNISDFINQLQIKLTDLDMVGKIGYSEGISKIFIRGLKELDIFKRPIHCSDLKREVMYVKDKDSWEKDNEEKNKMKTAIKHVAAKNFKQIQEWKEEHPDSEDYNSITHMEYHNIMLQSTGGISCEDEDKKNEKIIRNIAKEVVIDKSTV